MAELGFVIVEYNQASGQPELFMGGDLYPSRDEADETIALARAATSRAGRLETYQLAEVRPLGEPR